MPDLEVETIKIQITMKNEQNLQEPQKQALNIPVVMPRLICHYNEREGGYLTIGKIYQAISVNEDGWLIKDDSGDYNIYSSAYLNEA